MQVNRLVVLDEQGAAHHIPEPSLETIRARLLAAIRQKPVSMLALPQPKPEKPEPTLLDVREWQRRSRSVRARQVLRSIPDTTNVATVIGVTGRAVNYWRTGECAPTAEHWQQLAALQALLRARSNHS